MVIGNGMIAKRFEQYRNENDFVIFASGVSNSKNSDSHAYAREIDLVQSAIQSHKEKTLVYFSTCSFYDPGEMNSRYVRHKQEIEELIREKHSRYHIIRASNVVGRSDNPNTILNFFVYHIRHRINFDLWTQTERNLLDIDDLFAVVDHILQHKLFLNSITNVSNPVNYNVETIIAAIESFLQVKANYIPIQKGSQFTIDTSAIRSLFTELQLHFDNDYLSRLLHKYYSNQ